MIRPDTKIICNKAKLSSLSVLWWQYNSPIKFVIKNLKYCGLSPVHKHFFHVCSSLSLLSSTLKVWLNTVLLFLLLSPCCLVTPQRLHPAILLVLIRAWLGFKHGHAHAPNQYRIYRGSFSLLTELSSQGWLVSPGCGSLAELHTSRMAADTETHFELLKPTKQSKVHTTVLSSLADL